MEIRKAEQLGFSGLLFDTLFGLIFYYSIDSFLDIKDPTHFIFYLFSIVILAHRWLYFKASKDAFNEEVSNSAIWLLVGIAQLVLIEFIVLFARTWDYIVSTYFLIALVSVDMLWTCIWRYIGKRRTTDKQKIRAMESELNNSLRIDIIGLILFISLVLLAPLLSPLAFVIGFIALYCICIVLSFVYKIIDIDIF